MIFLGLLAQNVASGCMFGSFGALVLPLEHQMHVDRTWSSAGAPLVLLAIGAVAPFLGFLIGRFGLRRLMMAGALLCGTGYGAASCASGIRYILVCCALLIGPGIALLAVATPSALVANWFVVGRGRAIGIVNMPIAVAIMPVLATMLLNWLSLSSVYVLLSAATLLLLPALYFVVDRPQQIGMLPIGHCISPIPEEEVSAGAIGMLKKPGFWLIVFPAAITAGGDSVFSGHFIPFAIERGVAASNAAFLLSLWGAAGIVGALLYGLIVDRVGGRNALIFNSICQGLLWLGLLFPMSYSAQGVLVALIGLNALGMTTCFAATISHRFGASGVGGALGMFMPITLPFNVGMPILIGLLYAHWGYAVGFSLQIALFVLAAILATAIRRGSS